MADELRIQEICNRCNGTGVDPRGEEPASCEFCNGDGWVTTDKIDITAVITKFDGLDTKLDALEAHLDVIEALING